MTAETPDDPALPAFEPLIGDFLAKHRPELLAHARWVMGSAPRGAEPEDIVQAASLSFCLYLRKQKQAVLDRGLLVLARQCIETAWSDLRKWQDARKRREQERAIALPSSHGAPPIEGPGPATAVAQHERSNSRREAVRQALAALDPLDRRIMQLRLEDEDTFTFAKIGELVCMKEDAVRMRYRRAVAWMKTELPHLLAGDSEFHSPAN